MRKSSIEAAIINGKEQEAIKDWAETAYRMSFGKNVFKGSWTLDQHIDFAKVEFEKVRSEMNTPKQKSSTRPTRRHFWGWGDLEGMFNGASDYGK